MARNVLQVNLKQGDADLTILVEFLRRGAISSRAIEALSAFFFSLAVADNPNSTKEDIRKAQHQCLSKLKAQICFLNDKHSRDSDIKIEPDDFATVMINLPMDYGSNRWAPTQSGKSSHSSEDSSLDRSTPEVDSTETVGERLSRENQERSEEIDRESAANADPINKLAFAANDAVELEEEVQPDVDDDYDPEDDLSDEEYLKLQRSRTVFNKSIIVD